MKMMRNISKTLLINFLLVLSALTVLAPEPLPGTPAPSGDTGCIEEWTCSPWSDCVNGLQTRTCQELSTCGTIKNKPSETKSCGTTESEDTSKTEETPELSNKTSETTDKEEGEGSTFFSGLKLKIIIIAPLFLIAGIIIFFVFKKKTSAYEQPSYGVIEEQKKEETKTVTEDKPTMPAEEVKPSVEEAKTDPRLAEYIQTSIKKGFTKGQIKESLIKAGWDGKEVDAALAKY